MQNIYSTAKICRPNNPAQCLTLDPDLTDLMAHSSDYCELQWAWESWRNATGQLIRPYYHYYVHLINEAANIHNMRNAKHLWIKAYTDDEPAFLEQLEQAWQMVKPFYEHLHAYVRKKLIIRYGKDKFPQTGHIPAHLLGNMWAQDWSSLYSLVRPDKRAEDIDVTKLLKDAGYDVEKMVRLADDLFMSIGMEPMTREFWMNSEFRKKGGVDTMCHASAWDFLSNNDFRIKMCAKVDQLNFQTIHHEMGHIQYYMHYKQQPVEFRKGANPGFHEAIGDLVALSVMSPVHLKAINLLPRHFPENEGMHEKTIITVLVYLYLSFQEHI